jgi:hypothetical protein
MNKISPQVDLKTVTSLSKKTVIQYISRDRRRELSESAMKPKQEKYGTDCLEEFPQRNAWQIAIAKCKTHSHRRNSGLLGKYSDF